MLPEPPLPAVVLARAVVADAEAQAAEPVVVVLVESVELVQLRFPRFLVQLLPLVLAAVRLRLAEAAAEVAEVDVAVVVLLLLPLHL